jgi:hypothetical protein
MEYVFSLFSLMHYTDRNVLLRKYWLHKNVRIVIIELLFPIVYNNSYKSIAIGKTDT